MGLQKKTISDREKAALYLHVFGRVDDWKRLYIIASDSSAEEATTEKFIDIYASRWKNSDKVRTFMEEIRNQAAREQVRRDDQSREAIRAEVVQEIRNQQNQDGKKGARDLLDDGGVDFTRPENQRRKLNHIINDAKDSGEALDALKLIISTQKDDRQAAREAQTVRAYLPMTCDRCPLYDAARRKLQKR